MKISPNEILWININFIYLLIKIFGFYNALDKIKSFESLWTENFKNRGKHRTTLLSGFLIPPTTKGRSNIKINRQKKWKKWKPSERGSLTLISTHSRGSVKFVARSNPAGPLIQCVIHVNFFGSGPGTRERI